MFNQSCIQMLEKNPLRTCPIEVFVQIHNTFYKNQDYKENLVFITIAIYMLFPSVALINSLDPHYGLLAFYLRSH